MAINQQSPQLPPISYCFLATNIDPTTIGRIMFNLSAATTGGVQHLHMLLQSTGGIVGDGIALYNFLKTLPIELTVYNSGTVSSIAVVAYLGAKTRIASAHSTFMLHRTSFSPQNATANAMSSFAEAARLDDKRTEAILRAHINMPRKRWNEIEASLFLSAQEAVQYGIAHSIGEFSPPPGTRLFSV